DAVPAAVPAGDVPGAAATPWGAKPDATDVPSPFGARSETPRPDPLRPDPARPDPARPDPLRSTGRDLDDEDDDEDDDDERPRHPYTWLHLIVLALVAFVLGFLIVLLLNNARPAEPGTAGASATVTVVDGPPGAVS
ncbi:hypothetical protein HLB10_16820, partial [Cellulomonas fimi]|nr:hypothetical protein [Cellulomonas fimi]